ncbi:MAG: hypothetical protein WCC53_16015 [Thermoanaerobaculia bacterium]|jgi:hypothetical protein
MVISSERTRALLLAAATALAPAWAQGQAVQGGALPVPLPLFPASNWWNVDVRSAPVDPNSGAILAWIGLAKGMHPDFGGDSTPSPAAYGMPYAVVPGTQPLEPMAFDYASESDTGAPGRPSGYPIPAEAKTQPHWIEGGYPGNCDSGYAGSPCRGDKHVLVVDEDHRLLFETWNTRCLPAGSPTCAWRAGSGAVFSLDSNARRPDGWTSADAAGLAILPGLVRYDEVTGPDPIRHAFRFTLRDSNGYVYPASHVAGSNPNAPPLGLRLRLKAAKDLSGFPASAQKIFLAMKTYGLVFADNGTDLYVQGTYDTRWDNGVLNPAFAAIHASDFEVVQLGWKPPVSTVSGPLSFHTLPPCRVVDTRASQGPGALPPNGSRVVPVATVCGVPAAAWAVSANVTVLGSGAGSISLYPGDGGNPGTRNVSFSAGQTRAAAALLYLATDGSGSVGIANISGASNHFILDVNGYFQ